MARSGMLRVKKSRKPERLEARITADQKRVIEHAAYLRGTSVTDFVISSAHQAATEVIKDSEVLRLGADAREAFVKIMLNPPKPNAALRAAARRYKKYMGL